MSNKTLRCRPRCLRRSDYRLALTTHPGSTPLRGIELFRSLSWEMLENFHKAYMLEGKLAESGRVRNMGCMFYARRSLFHQSEIPGFLNGLSEEMQRSLPGRGNPVLPSHSVKR